MALKVFAFNSGKELIIKRDDIKTKGTVLFPGAFGKIVLSDVLSDEGGEGKVYKIKSIKSPEFDDEMANIFVAKIYHDDETANTKKSKILKMLSMINNFFDDESLNNVCWPYYAIYDDSTFVGFVMPKATGKTLANLFYPDIIDVFEGYTRKDIVKICLTIISKITQLHKHKIIIGDINEDNFIINSPDEIYFIDTDSYQFGDHLCKVERLEYKAPELIENDNSVLTLKTEGYSTAVLIFKLLMLGKHPFSCKNVDELTIEDRIVKGLFPYSNDKDITMKLAPIGFYSFIWNEFTTDLKMIFINIFTRALDLTSVNVLSKPLKDYIKDLDSRETLDLIPKSFYEYQNAIKKEFSFHNIESQNSDVVDKPSIAGDKNQMARMIINKFNSYKKTKSHFKNEHYFEFINKYLCQSDEILPNRLYFEHKKRHFEVSSVDLNLKVSGGDFEQRADRRNDGSKKFIEAVSRMCK